MLTFTLSFLAQLSSPPAKLFMEEVEKMGLDNIHNLNKPKLMDKNSIREYYEGIN